MKRARSLLAWLAAASLLALGAASAAAQPADADKGAGKDAKPNPDDEPPSDEAMSGIDENPKAPKSGEDATIQPAAPPPVSKRSGYPIEEVLRPLTLPATTSEIGVDLRSTVEPIAGATLRARYGITRQIQIGLRYGAGGLFASDTNNDGATDGDAKFHAGKAVAIDGAFLITDWAAAQLSVPMYLDPFAMGIVLGAPLKFRFGSKFAIYGLSDLIEFTAVDFVPSVTSEAYNDTRVRRAAINTQPVAGALRPSAGTIYQVSPDMAVISYLAIEMQDFKNEDVGYTLEGILQYSMSSHVDLSGRLGFDRLDDANSFGLRLSAQIRI